MTRKVMFYWENPPACCCRDAVLVHATSIPTRNRAKQEFLACQVLVTCSGMVILNGMVNTKFLYFENRPESLRLSVSHFWPPALGRLTASFSWDASETGRCASAGITSIIEKDRDQLQVDTEHVASVPSRIWPLEFRDFIL